MRSVPDLKDRERRIIATLHTADCCQLASVLMTLSDHRTTMLLLLLKTVASWA